MLLELNIYRKDHGSIVEKCYRKGKVYQDIILKKTSTIELNVSDWILQIICNEDMAFYRLILRKDIRHLSNLSTKDSSIDEQFSKPEDRGLKVNSLRITTMRIYDLTLRYPSRYEKSRRIEEL
ncbi:MAG TPA: hypothetical protein VEL11_00265 [Candidatus Bathyarchaeia archaeon]|nr:hypothetical protein [Candidatus Bathyarchaeia archaeon]